MVIYCEIKKLNRYFSTFWSSSVHNKIKKQKIFFIIYTKNNNYAYRIRFRGNRLFENKIYISASVFLIYLIYLYIRYSVFSAAMTISIKLSAKLGVSIKAGTGTGTCVHFHFQIQRKLNRLFGVQLEV